MTSTGAVEYEVETTQHDTAGRITRRTIAGHHYHYSYDAIGRLVSYIDSVDSSNNAAYKYDALGNRVEMTVGGVRTRFIYQGADVIADLVDENNDGVIDRKRYYWNLQKIDQKGGFVDVDPDGTRHWYYYLTDQVGSVLAVIDSDGNIVNQYDYDAFGNLIEENSFEQVPNRYRFHGREYDKHRGDYYYRLRTYIPEWGMFTGPDRDIRLTDPNGACNYLFCSNNPLVYVDPWGLEEGLGRCYFLLKCQKRCYNIPVLKQVTDLFYGSLYGLVNPDAVVDCIKEKPLSTHRNRIIGGVFAAQNTITFGFDELWVSFLDKKFNTDIYGNEAIAEGRKGGQTGVDAVLTVGFLKIGTTGLLRCSRRTAAKFTRRTAWRSPAARASTKARAPRVPKKAVAPKGGKRLWTFTHADEFVGDTFRAGNAGRVWVTPHAPGDWAFKGGFKNTITRMWRTGSLKPFKASKEITGSVKSLFKPVTGIGPARGWKRLAGHHFTSTPGNVSLATGKIMQPSLAQRARYFGDIASYYSVDATFWGTATLGIDHFLFNGAGSDWLLEQYYGK